MEQLIILAIIVGASLLHSWWKKKQGEGNDEWHPFPGEPPRPRPPARPAQQPAPAPAPKKFDLEEELRRLLGEEEPKREPPRSMPPSAPPPLPPVPPRPVIAPPPPVVTVAAAGGRVSGPLSTAAQAYLRGSHLESKVAAHMQRVAGHVFTHRVDVAKPELSPEVREALALLRTRRSQRAAIIASIVLGPPKAMEKPD